MKRLALSVICAFLGCLLAGCGKPETPAGAAAQGSSSANAAAPAPTPADAETEAAQIPANMDPKDTVVYYLQAVKDGNEDVVAALLTDLARRKTAEANIAVAPPGSETATFKVGNMELVTDDKKTAHVASMWTDNDEQGNPQTLRIVWVVRQEPAGWRVAGMVTRLAPDRPMLVLNFEEPEEVIKRGEEELARRRAANEDQSRKGTAANGETPVGQAAEGAPLNDAPRQARGPLEIDPITPR